MSDGRDAEERDWLAHPRAMIAPLYEDLGFTITDGGEGWLEITLTITERLMNNDGVLHGGMWALVADSTMGGAVRTLIERNERVLTSQSDLRWLRPIDGDILRCVGRVFRRGRRVTHCSVELFDATGRLVGSGGGTFVVVERDPDAAFSENS
jgi:uncharacterized protein (TIGR00369 family)